MDSGRKGKVLVRGVARSVGQIDGLAPAFRIVVKKDGQAEHFTVEAETLQPASEDQLASLSAKLLDALTVEMDDIVRDLALDSREHLTLRVVQPGTLPRDPATGEVRPVVSSRRKFH